MSKLTALHVHLIGLFVAALVAGLLFYTLIPKAQENVKAQKAAYDKVQADASTRPAKEREYKEAVAKKEVSEKEYARYEKQYMPVLGFTHDRLTTMEKVFWPNHGKSWPERFLKAINAHMDRERAVNGIEWLNAGVITFPGSGPDPNTVELFNTGDQNQPIMKYSFPVSVQAKNMDRLMRHIQGWYHIKNAGVPVVEGVQVAGNSPALQAQYNVTLTIIMHEKLPNYVPRIGGGGGAAGGGSAGGAAGGAGASMLGRAGGGAAPGTPGTGAAAGQFGRGAGKEYD